MSSSSNVHGYETWSKAPMHNLPTPTSLIRAVYHSIDTFAIKLSQQSFAAAHKFAKPLFWQHKNNNLVKLQHFCNM